MILRQTTKEDKLKRRIDARREDRQKTASMTEEYRTRERIVKDALPRTAMGFFCEYCKKDFDAIGHKKENIVFDLDTGLSYRREGDMPRAWYVAFCPKRHECRRYITGKDRDPYYFLSDVLKRQRKEMERDLLQPNDPRFKYVYPEAWKKLHPEETIVNPLSS